jgi:hypothetical protein
MRGDAIGIIAGIIDMFSPILEGFWILVMLFLILGLSLLAIPFFVPILLLISIIEIMMLVIVVLGWKTLR